MVAVGLAVGVGVKLGTAVELGVAVSVGVALGVSVGVSVNVGELVAVGRGVAVGWLRTLQALSSIAMASSNARLRQAFEKVRKADGFTQHRLTSTLTNGMRC